MNFDDKVATFLFLFFVGLPILVLIKDGITKAIRESDRAKGYSTSNEKKGDYRLSDAYDLFADVLNNAFEFIDAYLSDSPYEWVHLFISTISEVSDYSTDSYDYFIKITVMVGSWHESSLYGAKDIKDYMTTVFEFNPQENEFVDKIRIGISTHCTIPNNEIKSKLSGYLDRYEKSNPGRKLSRTSYGIHNQWNL